MFYSRNTNTQMIAIMHMINIKRKIDLKFWKSKSIQTLVKCNRDRETVNQSYLIISNLVITLKSSLIIIQMKKWWQQTNFLKQITTNHTPVFITHHRAVCVEVECQWIIDFIKSIKSIKNINKLLNILIFYYKIDIKIYKLW